MFKKRLQMKIVHIAVFSSFSFLTKKAKTNSFCSSSVQKSLKRKSCVCFSTQRMYNVLQKHGVKLRKMVLLIKRKSCVCFSRLHMCNVFQKHGVKLQEMVLLIKLKENARNVCRKMLRLPFVCPVVL